MICQKCKESGLKSKVFEHGPMISTLMSGGSSWFDEDGKYFPATDLNFYYQDYRCSNGHSFTVTSCQGEEDKINFWEESND